MPTAGGLSPSEDGAEQHQHSHNSTTRSQVGTFTVVHQQKPGNRQKLYKFFH
jgi:hypothetical protein